MSDPTQPYEPVDVTATMAAPTAPEPATPQVRIPFEITKFRTRREGLQLVGTKRSGMGYEQIATDALLDEMYDMLEAQYRVIASLSKGKDRVHGLWQKQLRRANALEEELKRRSGEGLDRRAPAQVVGAMTGGQLHSEKVIADAEVHAARIVATAQEDAARVRAASNLDVGDVPDRPTPVNNDGPGYVLALMSWLPKAIAAKRARRDAAKAIAVIEERDLDELQTEHDSWNRVVELGPAALAGDVIDVTESTPQEVAS